MWDSNSLSDCPRRQQPICLRPIKYRFSLGLRYFARFTTVSSNLKWDASFPMPFISWHLIGLIITLIQFKIFQQSWTVRNISFSPIGARTRISALRGLCSNQLNYRTKIINKIFKFRAMLNKQSPLLKYYIYIYKTAHVS